MLAVTLFSCNPWFAGFLIAVIIIGTFLLAIYSNMLRDEINDPVMFLEGAKTSRRLARKRKKKIPRPYSLSRSQLAFWTVIITSTYIYLVFCKHCGRLLPWDASTLAMLGISMGTTIGGTIIDKSQEDLKRHQNFPSRGFAIDILSDVSGVTVTRFQQVAWTFIAAVLYVSQLPNIPAGRFPQLDSSILLLSGLSSAAYLSVKVGENTGRRNAASPDIDDAVPAVTALPGPTGSLTPGEQSQPN